MSAACDVRGLAVRMGGHDVLSGVDLSLAAGEHVLLVGRSGSGKTTLLRAIAGLVRPHRGTVHIGGARASDGPTMHLRPEQRGIGFLFQGAALWPHWTAEKSLRFALGAAGVPRAERRARVEELLAAVHLEGFERRRPGSLSGGEAQRLALARALAAQPRILLLDEPLGPLDAELRDALLDTLDELRRERGFCALHVTHDPAESRRVATRVLHLENGRLEAQEEGPRTTEPATA